MFQARQGDIIIREASTPLAEIEAVSHIVANFSVLTVAEGEMTGHSHRLGVAKAYQSEALVDLAVAEGVVTDRNGLDWKSLFCVVPTTPLEHQEHDAIQIMPDVVWILPKRTYSRGEVRKVLD